ncbi:hypothetical protein BC834DRAFT_1043996 [Gloeopeniophorella convolvens]|nr:hypothetical protein BC834DRAFT_1043996 [Gloeopeniophorella convolvens]
MPCPDPQFVLYPIPTTPLLFRVYPMHSISNIDHGATAISSPHSTCPTLKDHRNRRVSIDVLPSEILLDIFEHYLSKCIRSPFGWSPQFSWCTLAHVSARWREVLFASAQRLNLILYCNIDSDRFNAEMIALAPSFPLAVFTKLRQKDSFDRFLRCALQYWDRICQIVISGSPRVVYRLLATMPDWLASSLVDFSIQTSQDDPSSTALVPGRTRVTLTDICIGILPPMLSGPTSLAPLRSLTLYGIDPGSISPKGLAVTLRAAPQLTRLFLYLDYHLSRSRDVEEGLLPATDDVIHLPLLQRLDCQGPSWWVEALAARLEAPALNGVDAQICDEGSPALPHLFKLVVSAPCLRFDRAVVRHDHKAAEMQLFEGDHCNFSLQVFCTGSDDRTRSLFKLSKAIGAKLSTVRRLTIMALRPPNPDPESRPWLNFLLPFSGLRSLCVDPALSLVLCHHLCSSQTLGRPEGFLPDLQRIVVLMTKINGRVMGPDDFGPDVFAQYRDERKYTGQVVPILWGVDPDRCDWQALMLD